MILFSSSAFVHNAEIDIKNQYLKMHFMYQNDFHKLYIYIVHYIKLHISVAYIVIRRSNEAISLKQKHLNIIKMLHQ